MKPQAFIPLIVFIALAVLLAIGLTRDPKLVPSPLIGKPAPAFLLSTVHNPNQQVSEKELLGKVSLVNVWASWCPSCREEHPVLVEFARSTNTPIYGLNWKDQREDAIRWLKHFGNPYVLSFHDPDNRAGLDWGVYGAPETFLVDKKGIIRFKQVGPVTPKLLQEKLIPMIKKLEQEQG